MNGIKRSFFENSESAEWFGLYYLWELGQDNMIDTISDETLLTAYSYFESLAQWQYTSQERFTIVEKCIENLKSNSSVVQALKVLASIISSTYISFDNRF